MDHKDIQTRVNAISKAMLGKGLRKPNADLRIAANVRVEILLRWQDPTKPDFFQDVLKFIGGDTPEDALDNADSFIAALPSAEEAKLNQFMGALANVIDLGKDNGVDVEFLNPLAATMKKLSDNILTDQRAA